MNYVATKSLSLHKTLILAQVVSVLLKFCVPNWLPRSSMDIWLVGLPFSIPPNAYTFRLILFAVNPTARGGQPLSSIFSQQHSPPAREIVDLKKKTCKSIYNAMNWTSFVLF